MVEVQAVVAAILAASRPFGCRPFGCLALFTTHTYVQSSVGLYLSAAGEDLSCFMLLLLVLLSLLYLFIVSYQLQQFGTHHAKMMVLKFRTGVRVVVLTANFVQQDVDGKSQGVWYQEFPLRASGTCDFEVRPR